MIFVVGNSRSGTTLLGRVLGRHPDVFCLHELHFFEQLWNPTQPATDLTDKAATKLAARLLTIQRDGYYTQGNPKHYRDEAASIIESLDSPVREPDVYRAFVQHEAKREGKSRSVDHTPRNLYYLAEVLELYPDARAIVMVRDPRDVLLSQKHRWKRRFMQDKRMPWWNTFRTWAGYHPITMSMLWRGGVRRGERMAEHPRVATVHLETLVRDPDAKLRELCEWLGLEYTTDLLNVPHLLSSHQADQPDRIGIDPSVAGRWRHGGLTPTEVATCQHVAGPEMRRHGYEFVRKDASFFALIWNRVTWVFKSALALLLNLRRMGNIAQAVRRRFR